MIHNTYRFGTILQQTGSIYYFDKAHYLGIQEDYVEVAIKSTVNFAKAHFGRAHGHIDYLYASEIVQIEKLPIFC